jgi:4'-phosphopantetheinyl transferase
MSASVEGGPVPITRWYIDTRALEPEKIRAEAPLPLLSTVSAGDQANITRFMQANDKLMSLASTLLKYLFIHRTAQIPWSQVTVSRWPAPHKRPYWSPPPSWPGPYGLEFNVSHQAGLTALVGCKTPDKDSSAQPDVRVDVLHNGTSPYNSNANANAAAAAAAAKPRLGVDITCTSEAHRGPRQMTTSAEFAKWVDIFAEMFSARERHDMQHAPTTTDTEIEPPTEKDATLAKLRRFYTYWSLKEAYIKMVGEGLLASWLRELEFSSVVSPPLPAPTPSSDRQPAKDPWGPTIHSATEAYPAGFKISVRQQSVKDVSMSLTAYGSTFIVATATKGISPSPSDLVPEWRQIDIEQDIRPCAEGRCDCPLLL